MFYIYIMGLKEFYENIVTFDKYIEFRIMNIDTGKMFSVWCENIDQVLKIYDQYDKHPYNIYYGINTRPTKERKEINIPFRRLFYWDIEHATEKPPITNEAYKKELMETAHYIIVQLHKQYGIKPLGLIVSGRGLHLYYRTFPLNIIGNDYNQKFKLWFKQTQRELDKKKPFEHIKLMDSVFDAGRIASAPFSHHNKYPEKPLREIIQIKPENICDMQNILDNFKLPEKKFKGSIKKGKWNEKNIFDAPEFKVFELKVPEMKGFGVHSRLRVALILFMDLYGIENREEVAQRIVNLGYWYEAMTPIDSPEYVYSESILNNWVFDHWEFCLEKGFKLPYHISKNKVYGVLFKDDVFDWDEKELKSVWDVYYYAKNFNNSNCKYLAGDRIIFYPDALAYNVFKNISDEKLINWIKENDFIKEVKVLR
jgi:hypothetical protein